MNTVSIMLYKIDIKWNDYTSTKSLNQDLRLYLPAHSSCPRGPGFEPRRRRCRPWLSPLHSRWWGCCVVLTVGYSRRQRIEHPPLIQLVCYRGQIAETIINLLQEDRFSSVTVWRSILLASFACFALHVHKKKLEKKSVSQLTQNALKRIEMHQKKKKKKKYPFHPFRALCVAHSPSGVAQ